MDELLFVYGTLKEPNVQLKVIGRTVEGTPDILAGYTKSTVTIDGTVYPIILPQSDSLIKGLILRVTPEELKKIDEYETNAYKRAKVTLKSGTITWVYQK